MVRLQTLLSAHYATPDVYLDLTLSLAHILVDEPSSWYFKWSKFYLHIIDMVRPHESSRDLNHIKRYIRLSNHAWSFC